MAFATHLDSAMFLVLATLIAPVLLRVAQVTHFQGRMASADLRGIVADLGVSFVLAGVGAAVLKFIRPKVAVPCVFTLLIAWAILNFGNFEHIAALGSVADWSNARYLLDETFLVGSALHISDLPLFSLCILLTVVCFLVFLRQKQQSKKAKLLPGIAAACLAGFYSLPTNPAYATWRQTHFILENLQRLAVDGENTAGGSEESVFGIYPGDLGGSPIVALNHPRTNVLLVVLEGISGSTLDVIAERQGWKGMSARLPSLNSRLSRGLTYVNFINHQRQTNRGLYSLLCGDLDKLSTSVAKMTEASLLKEGLYCLPEALRRMNYRTAFLQSAPLSFMGKDVFAPKAGFEQYHGVEWFRESTRVNSWGADDRLFLKKSAELIEDLRRESGPWFLTLLTSGTHHPFNVPESFESAYPPQSFSHAAAYLDRAVDEFLSALEKAGVFDDTLVLFTSDESYGLPGELGNDEMTLGQAWGYLAAFLPSKEAGIVEQAFMQTDMPISILDYLGAKPQAEKFRGRSIFRKYISNRPVPFGNVYLRMTGAFGPENDLFLCPEGLIGKCTRHAIADPARLFAPLSAGSPVDPPEFLKTIVKRSTRLEAAFTSTNGTKHRALFPTPTVVTLPVELMKRRRTEKLQQLEESGKEVENLLATFRLFGSQYLALAKGEKATVDIQVRVSDRSDAVFFHTFKGVALADMPTAEEFVETIGEKTEEHALGTDTLGLRPAINLKTQKFLGRTVPVPAGGTFHYRYSFGADQEYQHLQFVFLAAPGGEKDAVIEIEKAELIISPISQPETETGLRIEAAEPAANVRYHTLGYRTPEDGRE